MDAANQYDEDYFINGQATGKSLYHNYRWLPHLTVPMAEAIVDHLGAEKGQSFLDFGCARGFVVKALCSIGYIALGYDISRWALDNCDPAVRQNVSNKLPTRPVDWIIAKDVLEHVPAYDVEPTLQKLMAITGRGLFAVVPLSLGIGEPYVVAEYEKDITHINRWPLAQWVSVFHDVFGPGWEISSRYRVQGVKDNYADWPRGNGFITCRKI